MLKPKQYATIESAIGPLVVYYLSSGNLDFLIYTHDISAIDSESFMNLLIPLICWPEDVYKSSAFSVSEPVLKSDEVERLSTEDKENIAEAFLRQESFLLHDIDVEYQNANGIAFGTVSDKKSRHQRKQGESNVDFLHRLLTIWAEKENSESRKYLGTFGLDIASNIQQTLLLGKSLTQFESIGRGLEQMWDIPQMKPLEYLAKSPLAGKPDKTSVASKQSTGYQQKEQIPQFKAVEYRNPQFEALLSIKRQMDEVVDNTREANVFADSAVKTQLQISRRILDAGNAAEDAAKRSEKVAGDSYNIAKDTKQVADNSYNIAKDTKQVADNSYNIAKAALVTAWIVFVALASLTVIIHFLTRSLNDSFAERILSSESESASKVVESMSANSKILGGVKELLETSFDEQNGKIRDLQNLVDEQQETIINLTQKLEKVEGNRTESATASRPKQQ